MHQLPYSKTERYPASEITVNFVLLQSKQLVVKGRTMPALEVNSGTTKIQGIQFALK
jgi:hypothetical protein